MLWYVAPVIAIQDFSDLSSSKCQYLPAVQKPRPPHFWQEHSLCRSQDRPVEELGAVFQSIFGRRHSDEDTRTLALLFNSLCQRLPWPRLVHQLPCAVHWVDDIEIGTASEPLHGVVSHVAAPMAKARDVEHDERRHSLAERVEDLRVGMHGVLVANDESYLIAARVHNNGLHPLHLRVALDEGIPD